MVDISFLGGGREVGRMGILLDNSSQRFLMEYGVNVERMDVPIHPKMPIDALLLSHPHLDHSGHIPSLYREGWKGRVYATPATFDISNMLLKDSLKVQKIKGMQPSYGPNNIAMMDNLGMNTRFGKPKSFKTATVTFNDAGHVPGSASILTETDDKRILFTGDIKFEETMLMNGAYRDYRDIDVLITESTYSYKDHPPRQSIVDGIRDMISKTIEGGGFALLPCFAVGRTQEMLLIASEMGYPVYIDGMGIRATKAALMHPESVKDHGKLQEAFGRAKKIRNNKQRKDALRKPSIIITTAGMLNGGPVHFYIKRLINKPENTMIMNGFQVDGTVGRTLLETGRYIYEDMDVKPRMAVEFMDLSAHCGKSNLLDFIEKTNPGKVFLVHGEHTEEFAKELEGMGFDATAPQNGDSFTV
ncbi:MAG: MBL fold metallo-hydrolase [Candidatus Aenigmatarchaeota archaeon]|nr:MAG: MBL fold metallo-hydrolase [Candidatus Aenigmarchaeota archaeon]